MSAESSNDSTASTSPFLVYGESCFFYKPSSLIYAAFNIFKILLLLPLCILILLLGLRRWRRRQRSTSTAPSTSHSDSFTYHMVVMELIGIFGHGISCLGIYVDHFNMIMAGFYLWSFTWYGQLYFHLLTCVERHLAVVHPITYVALRGERGVRIRNISVGSVWLLCLLGISLIHLERVYLIVDCFLMAISLVIISLCSVSVLRVLVHPGPGEPGGDRERVDQLKLRAFYMIVTIMSVLLLRCVWNIVWAALYMLKSNDCLLIVCEVWFNLPSSLVLPLLFLYRAGTFTCFNRVQQTN